MIFTSWSNHFFGIPMPPTVILYEAQTYFWFNPSNSILYKTVVNRGRASVNPANNARGSMDAGQVLVLNIT